MGLIVDASGMLEAGFWLIIGMEETHPRKRP
jgi:hypothetical protein